VLATNQPELDGPKSYPTAEVKNHIPIAYKGQTSLIKLSSEALPPHHLPMFLEKLFRAWLERRLTTPQGVALPESVYVINSG